MFLSKTSHVDILIRTSFYVHRVNIILGIFMSLSAACFHLYSGNDSFSPSDGSWDGVF